MRLLSPEVPAAFKLLQKFTAETVKKCFACFADGSWTAENKVFVGDGVAEVVGEDNDDNFAPRQTFQKGKGKGKERTHCDIPAMQIFQDLMDIHKGKAINFVMGIAKAQLPQIFQSRSNYETFKAFPARLAKLNAKRKAEEEKQVRVQQVKKQRTKGRKHAPSMDQKQAEVKALLTPEPNVRREQVVLTWALISLAMMLYSQYLAGFRLTCAIALPLILSFLEANNLTNLLYPQQPLYPPNILLRRAGIAKRSGRIFWTKRAVNQFFPKIGLPVRKATCNHNKNKKPDEVDALRKLMGLRLVFLWPGRIFFTCFLKIWVAARLKNICKIWVKMGKFG